MSVKCDRCGFTGPTWKKHDTKKCSTVPPTKPSHTYLEIVGFILELAKYNAMDRQSTTFHEITRIQHNLYLTLTTESMNLPL
jgi:hypothetical protein